MKKLFVSIPISSIWCWWRDRKARKLAERNERSRRRVGSWMNDYQKAKTEIEVSRFDAANDRRRRDRGLM